MFGIGILYDNAFFFLGRFMIYGSKGIFTPCNVNRLIISFSSMIYEWLDLIMPSLEVDNLCNPFKPFFILCWWIDALLCCEQYSKDLWIPNSYFARLITSAEYNCDLSLYIHHTFSSCLSSTEKQLIYQILYITD